VSSFGKELDEIESALFHANKAWAGEQESVRNVEKALALIPALREKLQENKWLREALEEIDAAGGSPAKYIRAVQWQPIETAPKGKKADGIGPIITAISNNINQKIPSHIRWNWCAEEWECAYQVAGGFPRVRHNPTHWQPLPQIPEKPRGE